MFLYVQLWNKNIFPKVIILTRLCAYVFLALIYQKFKVQKGHYTPTRKSLLKFYHWILAIVLLSCHKRHGLRKESLSQVLLTYKYNKKQATFHFSLDVTLQLMVSLVSCQKSSLEKSQKARFSPASVTKWRWQFVPLDAWGSTAAKRRGHLPHPGTEVALLFTLFPCSAGYFGNALINQGRPSQLHLLKSSSFLQLEWLPVLS